VASTGQRKILSPMKIPQPFSLKLKPSGKASMYGFGKLSGMVRPKIVQPTLNIGKLTKAARRVPGRIY